MNLSFERLSTGALMTCAILVTAVVVKREVWPANARPSSASFEPRDTLADWRAYVNSGEVLGNPDAKYQVLVFSDFQCPGCRAFATGLLPALRQKYGNRLAIRFRNWPLAYHPQAYPAALAAACAGRQGYFEEFHDYVFAHQESLGIVSYGRIASRAGVPDTVALTDCMQSQWADSIVSNDRRAAESAKHHGTPTIVFEGVRWTGVPDSSELFAEIDRIVN